MVGSPVTYRTAKTIVAVGFPVHAPDFAKPRDALAPATGILGPNGPKRGRESLEDRKPPAAGLVSEIVVLRKVQVVSGVLGQGFAVWNEAHDGTRG